MLASTLWFASEPSMRSVVFIAALSFLPSCGGGSSNATTDGGPSGSHSITYDFDGVAYAGSLLATATLMNNNAGGNDLGIEASDLSGHVLAIAVAPATPAATVMTGTYAVQAAPPLATFQFSNGTSGTWGASQTDGSGSLTITTLTGTEIKGTFSATMVATGADGGTGSGMLTNGAFDLPVN